MLEKKMRLFEQTQVSIKNLTREIVMRPQTDTDKAYHEAAHAVADTRFGCHPVKASIKPSEGTLGSVSSLDGWDDSETARNYVISCLAGYVTEIRLDSSNEQAARLGASRDFEMASKPLEQLNMDLQSGIAIAKEWVNRSENWKAIELVAQELLIHEELVGDEIETLVVIADGEATRETLASVRLIQRLNR
ncbi:MAG TPA: hypothetical protein VKX17_13455 [Planctomycetota bacterium]|nr:hypothetical protein [Planctomycetota bacterium]